MSFEELNDEFEKMLVYLEVGKRELLETKDRTIKELENSISPLQIEFETLQKKEKNHVTRIVELEKALSEYDIEVKKLTVAKEDLQKRVTLLCSEKDSLKTRENDLNLKMKQFLETTEKQKLVMDNKSSFRGKIILFLIVTTIIPTILLVLFVYLRLKATNVI